MENISLISKVIGKRLSEICKERNFTFQRMAVNADMVLKHLKKWKTKYKKLRHLYLIKLWKA